MRIESPFLMRAIGIAFGSGCRVLFKTLRKDVRSPEHSCPYNASGPNRYLFAVWHDSAVIAAFGGKHTRTVALTSAHRDGTFVTGVVGCVGVKTVRGSTGRAGGSAARRLLEVAKTKDIVITPDGPRGPRRQLSRGIIYLASRTGSDIVPTAFSCASAWEIPGSWTTQTIPKPFSYVAMLAGNPISVPRDISTRDIDSFKSRVQVAMDAIQERADAIVAQRSVRPYSSARSNALPATK